nr:MAG TPA: hypothetical protein [Caudoviricetes sp.]
MIRGSCYLLLLSRLKLSNFILRHCYYITYRCCCLWKFLIKILNMVYKYRTKYNIW